MPIRTTLLALAALASVSSLGCKSGSTSAPPTSGKSLDASSTLEAPAAPSGNASRDAGAPLRVEIEGDDAELPRGVARWSNGALSVSLGRPPGSCNADGTSSLGVSFDVPWGPGNRPVTQTDVNVWVQNWVQGPSLHSGPRPLDAVARLEPFEPKKGARIRGHLAFEHKAVDRSGRYDAPREYVYKGAGTFEVEICDDPTDAIAPPEDASLASPLHGTWSGKPLTFFDGIVDVRKDDANVPYVERIELPIGERFDCATRGIARRTLLDLSNIGGVSQRRPLAKSAQPVSVRYERRDVEHDSSLSDQPGHREWVMFDRLAFEKGGVIEGKLFASSAPGAEEPFRILGTFTARVCEVH